MYERLRVYINVEQNSTTNNSGKENFSFFWEFYVYMCGDTLHVYFFRCCCCVSFSIPSKKLKILFEAQNEKGYRMSWEPKREWWKMEKTQHEVFRRRCGYCVEKGGKKRGMLTVKAESFRKFPDCSTMNHLTQLFLTNKKMFKKSLVDDVWVENDGR